MPTAEQPRHRDYRDLALETLLADEADLLDQLNQTIADRNVYRDMALIALSSCARLRSQLQAARSALRARAVGNARMRAA